MLDGGSLDLGFVVCAKRLNIMVVFVAASLIVSFARLFAMEVQLSGFRPVLWGLLLLVLDLLIWISWIFGLLHLIAV